MELLEVQGTGKNRGEKWQVKKKGHRRRTEVVREGERVEKKNVLIMVGAL